MAVEHCKEKPTAEYEIRVHKILSHGNHFHDSLRFSLLASTWLPLPLGQLLWSALQVTLLVSSTLLFAFLFILCVAYALTVDVWLLGGEIIILVIYSILYVAASMFVALAWIWLLIFRQSCTTLAMSPGQFLSRYIMDISFGEVAPHASDSARVRAYVKTWYELSHLRVLVMGLAPEIVPWCIQYLRSWGREIVDMDDVVVI